MDDDNIITEKGASRRVNSYDFHADSFEMARQARFAP